MHTFFAYFSLRRLQPEQLQNFYHVHPVNKKLGFKSGAVIK